MRPTSLLVSMLATSVIAGFAVSGAVAQGTQMPLPGFQSTYSYFTHTRGLYFQLPPGPSVVITGLRVPDDTQFGFQNIEVIRLPGDPTAIAVTGTQLFFAADQPSAAILPCAITVHPGEWIGILGGCGDGTIMHSSYGTGPYLSDALGVPVVIERLACQANINLTGGNQPVIGGMGLLPIPGPIGRVEVYLSPAVGVAQSVPFGSGCGDPVITLGSDRPIEGTRINVTIGGIPSTTIIGVLVMSATSLATGSQPVPGLMGCSQFVGMDDLTYFVPTGTAAVLAFDVPVAALTGSRVYAQAVLFDPPTNAAGIASSNALEWLIHAN